MLAQFKSHQLKRRGNSRRAISRFDGDIVGE
jgi:hypothetical protein